MGQAVLPGCLSVLPGCLSLSLRGWGSWQSKFAVMDSVRYAYELVAVGVEVCLQVGLAWVIETTTRVGQFA